MSFYIRLSLSLKMADHVPLVVQPPWRPTCQRSGGTSRRTVCVCRPARDTWTRSRNWSSMGPPSNRTRYGFPFVYPISLFLNNAFALASTFFSGVASSDIFIAIFPQSSGIFLSIFACQNFPAQLSQVLFRIVFLYQPFHIFITT